MLRVTLTCILAYVLAAGIAAQDSIPEAKLSLLFIGDIMGHDDQILAARNKETGLYDYNEVFSYIRPVISEADVAIANFEVTLAGKPFKGYPQFSSPPEFAEACKNSGIGYFVTANNHSADRGKKGIEGTILKLDSMGIYHTGTFISVAEKEKLQPVIIEKDGISVALLNYTYGTNGIDVPYPVLVNFLDKELIAGDIRKARSLNPDLLVLFLHWGVEYDTIPSPEQEEMAQHFFTLGADLVIGSHPHVLQKMVWHKDDTALKNKAVIYSLGNFVSNQRKRKTDGGSMVRIEIEKKCDTLIISNVGYYLTWVYMPVTGDRKNYHILPCSEYENKPGFFTDPADFKQMMRFIKESRALLQNQNININEIFFKGPSSRLNN